MNLDNDVEEARRRLATLATIERPQIVEDSTERPVKPTPRSTKKPRASFVDVPELTSPVKGRFPVPPMATISEPGTSEMEEGEEQVDHTASRLQRLMRTVENETRRESIRESRQSMGNPAGFYSPAGKINPTTYTVEKADQDSPAAAFRATKVAHQIVQSTAMREESHASRRSDAEESDTSAKDSEKPVVAKNKRPARAPAKQSAPVTGKRTVHAVERSEDQMLVDDATATSEDVQMEETEERPAKKARTTRKAEPAPAPRARRATKKIMEPTEEDNADEVNTYPAE
jgi:hypothetical protein